MTNIEKLVAIQEANGVELNFLGHLAWYTVTGCRIPRVALEEILKKTGIEERFMPAPINAKDAFRRATKTGEVKGVIIEDGKFLNVLVRDVRQDKDSIIRQLVREIVDGKKTRLEYKPVANLVLQKGHMHIIPLETMFPQELKAARTVQDAFETEKENYNDRTCRDIIYSVLKECRPVAVRPSGGVYFVPAEFEDKLESLQAFADEITAYAITNYKSRMYKVPVVDAEEQRNMIEASLEDQVKQETDAAVEDMAKLIKAVNRGEKKVTEYVANQCIDRARAIAKLVKSYEKMLNTQLVEAHANLELIMAQAMKVMDKVEVA